MMKEVTYHGMMEHFAKQSRKKLNIICNNLKITTAIDSNVKEISYNQTKSGLTVSTAVWKVTGWEATKDDKTNNSFED